MGCYIWYSEEGPARAAAPLSPLLAVLNVTAHPSTATIRTNFISFDVGLKVPLHCKGLKRILALENCMAGTAVMVIHRGTGTAKAAALAPRERFSIYAVTVRPRWRWRQGSIQNMQV